MECCSQNPKEMDVKFQGLVSGLISKTKSSLILGALDEILPIQFFPLFAHFLHLEFEIEAKHNHYMNRVAVGIQLRPKNLKPQP